MKRLFISAVLPLASAALAEYVVTPADAQRYCQAANVGSESLVSQCMALLPQHGLATTSPGEQRGLDGNVAAAIQRDCADARAGNDKSACASRWLSGVPKPAADAAMESFAAAEEARLAEAKAWLAALELRLKESEAARRAERVCKAKGFSIGRARIGMTTKQNLECGWGSPRDVNRTITATRTREQWVYGASQYLYFDNGRLVTIQD